MWISVSATARPRRLQLLCRNSEQALFLLVRRTLLILCTILADERFLDWRFFASRHPVAAANGTVDFLGRRVLAWLYMAMLFL